MNDESTVSLKVYLMEGKTNIEVRRFEVDQGVITNYDYIRERLKMAIPSIREKIFRLLWQDSEGDEVTISSDEELMIALSEIGKLRVCKFIVRLPEKDDDPDTFININIPSMHSVFAETANLNDTCPIFKQMQGELNCSSCKQPINDVRYKCLECAEYCQCPECEQKKVHPDHVMLRINKNFTLHSLIPKCMQIFKNHFIRGAGKCAGMSSFFRDRMSQCPALNKDSCPGDKDKGGKCSSKEEKGSRHHHRRFRRHGHCDKSQHKSSSENEEPMQTECPFSEDMLGNLGNLAQMGGLGNVVEAFLGMYKDAVKKSKPETVETPASAAGPSTSSATASPAPIKTIDLDGPPMPTAPEDAPMQEETAESQKDAKIKMALELLADMGFNNDNQWLSRLLEHFDGDIAKTLDHLTLGK